MTRSTVGAARLAVAAGTGASPAPATVTGEMLTVEERARLLALHDVDTPQAAVELVASVPRLLVALGRAEARAEADGLRALCDTKRAILARVHTALVAGPNETTEAAARRVREALERNDQERDAWRALSLAMERAQRASSYGSAQEQIHANHASACAELRLDELGLHAVTVGRFDSEAGADAPAAAPPPKWRGILARGCPERPEPESTPAGDGDKLGDAYARGCASAVDKFAPLLEQAERERDQARTELARRADKVGT